MNMKKLWLILLSTMLIFGFSAVASFADDVEAQNDGQTIAMIGDVEYPSLRAAVTAAQDGDTITMVADDRVSFSMDNLEMVINKKITIKGEGFSLYGVNNYNFYDEQTGRSDHDIFISGTKDIVIKDLTITEFGGSAYVSKRITPIWTAQAYSGTLSLNNVTFNKFNRTAVNVGSGTIKIDGCTITGDLSPRNNDGAYFQSGVETFWGDITISDTVITNMGAYDPKNADSNAAACVQMSYSDQVAKKGSIEIKGGTFEGQYSLISQGGNTADDTGVITVKDGTFDGKVMKEKNLDTIIIIHGSFGVNVTQFVDDAIPVAVISSSEGASECLVGEDLIKEAALDAENAIVVTQGNIDFDQDTTQAALANEGNGTVTIDEKLVGTTGEELAKLNEQVKEDAEKIAALEAAKKKAEEEAAAANKAKAQAEAQAAAAYTPAKVALKKVKKGKKKATVTFNRVEGQNIKYEIQFTNKTTNAVKKVTMKQGKKQTLKKTVKGLQKKTTYVVQVRAFNKVNGKTYYGKWSKKRNVKIK